MTRTERERLRVLVLPSWYPSDKNPVQGIFVRDHVRAASLHDDVIVLVAQAMRGKRSPFLSTSREEEGGVRALRVRFRALPVPRTEYPLTLAAYAVGLRALAGQGFRPDIIHAHVYSAGALSVPLASALRIPLVITEHAGIFQRRAFSTLELAKARFALPRATLVLPVSHSLQRAIEAYGITARFRVVPNPVGAELFHANGRSRKAPRTPRKILVTVCLLTDVKGLPYLLRALRALAEERDDFELWIVGDGEQRAEYERLTGALGLESVVRFLGMRTKDQIAILLKQADLFVLPSLAENLPVAVIEAAMSGVPILATTVGGVPEIVTEGAGRLVPPGDVQALVDGLRSMLDEEPRDSHAIALEATRKYSLEAVGSRLRDVYRDAIGLYAARP
jgi:glycosyltransferase involved in cell wall biosynthesis